MSDKIEKVLERGFRLLIEGKFEEALQLIDDFKEKVNLTPTEELRLKIFKWGVKLNQGEFVKTISMGEQLHQESQKLGKPLLSIESLWIKFFALFPLGRSQEFSKDLETCEILLQSAAQESFPEFEEGEARVSFIKGLFYWWEQKYDLAIEHQKKSLIIFEKILQFANIVPLSLGIIGLAHQAKGELDEALKYFLRSLDLSKGQDLLSKGIIANDLNGIGQIYYQQGKLDLAIENIEKSLPFFETINIPLFLLEVGWRYDTLIKIELDKKSIDQAQRNLRRYREYIEKNKITEDYPGYLLSKARIMRRSTRTRERAEAERFLIQEIERRDKIISRSTLGIPGASPIMAIIELCEYYLEELRSTNDLGILDDIIPLIDRLLKETKRTKSISLHSHTLLLQGQISLLQMNMGDARRYLTQAQDIAESHGLQLLARAISNEHDKLLEQLNKWETLKNTQAPISERMNLTLLDDTVDRMQGRLAVNPPELSDESPLLLLIISEGGVLTFSYPFVNEWNRDNELFGSFISAFSSISDEYFSEGLDRVKFGQHMALLRSNKPFLICYLFKGQTYKAIQKIDKFIALIQDDASIQNTLDKYYQTGQILELKEFPFLESLIKGIFT
ncbi:MAG: tetratricopeptide repeat protein [Candidatus Hodarchaeales archaeon]|jgi:tetratricopeptide (TPR) repeat protein